MRYQDPAVVVAGEYWTIERIQCLPEGFIGQVGEIKQYSKFFHCSEQFDARGCQTKFYGCTAGIATRAIMSGTNDADARLFPNGQLLRSPDWVRAFHADHETKRRLARMQIIALFPALPCGDVIFQLYQIHDQADFT